MANRNANILGNIITPAGSIRRTNAQKQELTRYMHDILTDINNEIKKAFINGNYSIEYELPSIFMVDGISNMDCQIMVWSHIFSDLINKKYTVNWYEENDKAMLIVSWKSVASDKSNEHRLNLINSLKL